MHCDSSHTTAFMHVAATAGNIHFSVLSPCVIHCSPDKLTPAAGMQSPPNFSHTSRFLPAFLTFITVHTY